MSVIYFLLISSMPYTESVIMEVLRTSPTVVLGLLHTITKDIEFHGYTLKKGTGVMANFFGIHNSKEIWGDPQNFRPERKTTLLHVCIHDTVTSTGCVCV